MPTRFGKREINTADQRLAAALSHPVRAECLTILNARVASPSDIARELGHDPSYIAYHVKQLLRYDCVELVETKPVRGATEHFYRGVAQKYLHDDLWGKLSHPVRNGISLTAIRVLIGAMRDSVMAGIFDRRKDRHISIITHDWTGRVGKKRATSTEKPSSERWRSARKRKAG